MRIEFEPWCEQKRLEAGNVDALEAVRHLHRPCTAIPIVDGGCDPAEHTSDPPCCLHCAHDWPCPTITAIDSAP